MELMFKVMFVLFTLLMWNYTRTMGRYDVHRARFMAYIYMGIAVILAAKV